MTGRSIPLLAEIPTNKLPTELQVLGHYLWLVKQQSNNEYSPRNLALQAVQVVIAIWEKAYIPHSDQKNVLRHFFDRNNSVFKS